MMHSHGEYPYDYATDPYKDGVKVRIFQKRLVISNAVAECLLARVASEEEKASGLRLVNKGFRFVDASHGELTAVYLHDGQYSLIACRRDNWESIPSWHKSAIPLPQEPETDMFGVEKRR